MTSRANRVLFDVYRAAIRRDFRPVFSETELSWSIKFQYYLQPENEDFQRNFAVILLR